MKSRNISVRQGEFQTSAEKDVVLSAILGSCTAACLFDLERGIGGMNHIVLPDLGRSKIENQSHGTHAMELLINDLLKKGARRSKLQAKIFGGARVISSLAVVGSINADFLRKFLAKEGIDCVAESLGGRRGRKVQFWPSTGRAQSKFLEDFQERGSSVRPKLSPDEERIEFF